MGNTELLSRFFLSFGLVSAHNVVILVLAIRVVDDSGNLNEIGRDTVTPPELARDAPVLNLLQPVEPGALVLLRNNGKLLVTHSIARSFG